MVDKADSRGRFIVFEGIDGTGKTTQMAQLAAWLRSKEIKVHETCEPTHGPVGSLIRQMMTGRLHGQHETIAALFVADRLDHLLNKTDGIIKKIEQGVTVLSDRYSFSSYAYQSHYVSMDWIIQANAVSAGFLDVDLTIFLDAPPEKCLNRIQRGRSHNALYEKLDILQSVRNNYLKAFEKFKTERHIVTIDADRVPDIISVEIQEKVSLLFS